MLFVLYGILLVGGIFVIGISFSVVGLEALVFVVGVLLVGAAVAVPISAGALEQRK